MVPQYKPESVLILGYAGGTTAGLIRLLYGDVPITAVDIENCENRYGVDFIQADAEEFVKTCGHFDAVVVDLFQDDLFVNCSFVNKPEFAQNLARIGNDIIVNTLKNLDMSAYKIMKHIGTNKPTGSSNLIYYYEVKKIPNLHPHK